MIKIVDPQFALHQSNTDIFNIRRIEYRLIVDQIRLMLKQTEEIGYIIDELGLKSCKTQNNELNPSIIDKLVIVLNKNEEKIDISTFIPRLINDNYIYLNGRYKLPQFQMIDIPIRVLKREDNQFNSLQIRTNVCGVICVSVKKSGGFRLSLSIMGKHIPLALFLISYFGLCEIEKMIALSNEFKSVMYQLLITDINYFLNDDRGDEDYKKMLGSYISNYIPLAKANEIIYAVNIIPKIDLSITDYLTNGSIVDEILKFLREEYDLDDSDLRNKRIRCIEYYVLSHMSKSIFNLCVSTKNTKKVKFNINQNQILTDCNVSSIVLFDFSINPIDELTRLTRVSLLGPGGFEKDIVPESLRDIHESMLGRICVVDTPDRDNCGVQHNLLTNVKLDNNLRFSLDPNINNNRQIISIPVSLTPFLEHDDQTRLQMSSSQMRQSIMLRDPSLPFVMSGTENLYTDKTQFIKIAKKDGEVIFIDDDETFILVRYNDGGVDIFSIEDRRIYIEHCDIMKVYVSIGDKFKKGDIIAESNFCINKNIVFGQNLLTSIVPYYGYNYEDGIVISDRLVKEQVFESCHFEDMSFFIPDDKVLLSLDKKVYKPLPNKEESIKRHTPYARLKRLPSSPLEFTSIFDEEDELLIDRDMVMVTEVNVYVNSYNNQINQYKRWVEDIVNAQRQKEDKLRKLIIDHVKDNDVSTSIIEKLKLNKFGKIDAKIEGDYKIKGEKFNGIFVEMYGVFFRRIEEGDKIGNRHGNKGVISKIIPHDMMPTMFDGRKMDIIINPLGVPSRMNVGQLFELNLSMSIYDLKVKMMEMLKEKDIINQNEIKKYLLQYIQIIDNTKDGWYYKQFENQLSDQIIDDQFIDELTIVQPPFESCNDQQLKRALLYTNTRYTYELFEPIEGKKLENEVSVGYMYFFRMVHIAKERLAARGVGGYLKKTLQPIGGIKNKGGQRVGEMETACFIAHDAPINLSESMTTKSDSVGAKNKWIKDCIDDRNEQIVLNNDDIREDDDEMISEAVKLLNANLKVLGIDLDD